MEFGYPGANTHLENHGVSEESFWPSFTDIMMVIVMVFLLVTVAVILNNWSLIGDLKNSIKAQQIATSLAENRQQENASLGSKLSLLEKKVVTLNDKYEQEKNALAASQQALVTNKQQLTDKIASLAALEEKLLSLDKALSEERANRADIEGKLAESQNKLTQQKEALSKLQINFDTAFEHKNKLAVMNKKQNSVIAENEKELQALQQALNANKTTISSLEEKQTLTQEELSKLTQTIELKDKVLANLQTDRSDLERKINLLQANSAKVEEAKNTGKLVEDALRVAQDSLKESEEEKQRIIVAMNNKLVEGDKKVTALESSIAKLKKQLDEKDAEISSFKDGNEKLRSLQGEYDTLDAKYQKLLRPARSSKGKYIVSVSYKKKAGKRIIRLKPGPDASYKTVNKNELHKTLEKLKAKHKTDLYLKVIIPETSGLSYNEAWKFTTNLQKKYDYYHQPDDK